MNVTLLTAFLLATPANAKSPTNLASPQIPELTKGRIQATFLRAPLHFEANQGQTDEQVKFLARGSGYAMFLTANEAVLVLTERSQKKEPRGKMLDPSFQLNPKSKIENPKSSVVRMKLIGANADAKLEGLRQLQGKVNYFIGNDPKKWRTNIPTYKRVEYQELYPGINLVFYGNQRQLEYDFVVSPGADPKAIKLAFEGADRVEMKGSDLVITTASGSLRVRKPLVYQEVAGVKKEIWGEYVLNPKSEIASPKSRIASVSFQVAAYDTTKALIIDPVLVYSTYLGGSGTEQFFTGIAVDSTGSAYVTGFTASVDFPTLNPLQAFNSGGEHGDALVTKLSASGSLVYSTYLGGSGGDFGSGIALEPGCATNYDVYIMGGTCSTNFPTMSPLQAALAGACDTFVTKLNAAGSALVYSTYLGGSGGDGAHAIAVDSSGKAHVTGLTHSSNFPTVNAFQPFYSGHRDSFVAKLNSEGSALIYSSYLGGNSVASGTTTADDETNSIAVDSSGNAYVTGGTSSTNFPTKNPFQASHGGGATDAFVTKVDATGSLVYSTYLGGNSNDRGDGIAIDSSGNAYITGTTNSTNFPTANALQASHGGGVNDAFVTKLNADGSALVYSTYLGGSGGEDALDVAGIAVDSSGNAYVTGRTFSTNFPTVNPLQAANSGDSDVFVAKLNTEGSALAFSTYLGGSGSERTAGIAVDPLRNVYVVGRTSSTDFPLVNPSQPVNAGGFDVFVAKITDAIPVTIDIKPGSFPNSINLGSGGTVPVAILSTASFDARTVDPTTVTLASAPVALKGKGTLMTSTEDVNGDGLLDQVVHVSTEALKLSETDEEAILEGKTSDGTPIRGKDTVRVVP